MPSVLETDLIVQQINETSCDQTFSAEDCFVTICWHKGWMFLNYKLYVDLKLPKQLFRLLKAYQVPVHGFVISNWGKQQFEDPALNTLQLISLLIGDILENIDINQRISQNLDIDNIKYRTP